MILLSLIHIWGHPRLVRTHIPSSASAIAAWRCESAVDSRMTTSDTPTKGLVLFIVRSIGVAERFRVPRNLAGGISYRFRNG